MEVLIFIIGLCLGSFYLVIGKRLPINEDVIKSRSRCDYCGHTLSFWELIPLVSYIILLGKCHKCHKRINILNPLIELTMGGIFLFGYFYFGISYDFFVLAIISSIMILIFITDFLYYIILDSPLIIGGILLIIVKLVYYDFKTFLISLASGIILFCVLFGIKLLGDFIFKRESLGGGDIKFAAIIGFVLGFKLGLCALILSTFLALPYSAASLLLKKNNEVAYGPFLAASLFIVFLFSDKFLNILDLIFF